MSFWDSILRKPEDTPGVLKPIVQRVPAPAAPARVSAARPAARTVEPAPAPALRTAPPESPERGSKPAAKATPPAEPRSQAREGGLVPAPAPKVEPPPVLTPDKVRAAVNRSLDVAVSGPPAWGRKEPTPPPAAPSEELAFLRRATVRQAQGDHAGAVEDFTRALALAPSCVEACSGRGISREQLGDIAGAKADYARSIDIELRAEIERQRRDNAAA